MTDSQHEVLLQHLHRMRSSNISADVLIADHVLDMMDDEPSVDVNLVTAELLAVRDSIDNLHTTIIQLFLYGKSPENPNAPP